MEKTPQTTEHVGVEHVPPVYDPASEKDARLGEGAGVFGDEEMARKYGYVTRGCVHSPSTCRNPLPVLDLPL